MRAVWLGVVVARSYQQTAGRVGGGKGRGGDGRLTMTQVAAHKVFPHTCSPPLLPTRFSPTVGSTRDSALAVVSLGRPAAQHHRVAYLA